MATNRVRANRQRSSFIHPAKFTGITSRLRYTALTSSPIPIWTLLKTIEVTRERKAFSWLAAFKVRSLVLDPHYQVLRWKPEFRADPGSPASSFKVRVEKEVGEQGTIITGTLLGHDDQPMLKAHLELSRFNQSKPLASVAVGQDGSFKLVTIETGLLVVRFTGVDHQSSKIILLVDKPMKIDLDVRLKTYDYRDDFGEVKIIGDACARARLSGSPCKPEMRLRCFSEFSRVTVFPL